MLPNPFKLLFELVAFGIQAAFIYSILFIASILFLIWLISDLRETAPTIKYETKTTTEISENIKTVKETETVKPEEKKLVCVRIEGCKTFPNAPTREEYCPTCVWK